MSNQWVNYAGRSFAQIKNQVLSNFKTDLPEITDYNSSNILVKILEVYAGIADQIHFYVDRVAKETFLVSQQKFENTFKLSKAYDYRIKGAFPSEAYIKFTLDTPTTADFTIPKTTLVSTPNGIIFETQNDVTILAGETNIESQAIQKTNNQTFPNYTSTGLAFQTYPLTSKVIDGTVSVKIDGIIWEAVDSFAYSGFDSKHFVSGINQNGLMEIRFGDGLNGLIPPVGSTVQVEFWECEGTDGNVSENSINTLVSPLVHPEGFKITIENPETGKSGANAESVSDLKKKIPNWLRSLEVAHNARTIKATAEVFQGVENAFVISECNQPEKVYVSPISGGLASDFLLSELLAYLKRRVVIRIQVETYSAGVIDMKFNLSITALPNYTNKEVKESVKNALLDFFSVQNQPINGSLEIAEVYAKIQKTEGVRVSRINEINYKPFLFTVSGNTKINYDCQILSGAVLEEDFSIVFTSPTEYNLLKDNILQGSYSTGSTASITEFDLTIYGIYEIGDEYKFKIYPYFDRINEVLKLNEPSYLTLPPANVGISVTGGRDN